MSILYRIGKSLFPDLVAPPVLKELPPSWAGIFKRIVRPTRIVKNPVYGTHSITLLSREEYQRLIKHNSIEMLEQCYPNYKEIDFRDYEPPVTDKNIKDAKKESS